MQSTSKQEVCPSRPAVILLRAAVGEVDDVVIGTRGSNETICQATSNTIHRCDPTFGTCLGLASKSMVVLHIIVVLSDRQ